MIGKHSLCLLISSFLLAHCASDSKKGKSSNIEDFSLGGDQEDEDLSSSHLNHRVFDQPSLPLPVRIGKGGKDFRKIPKVAYGGGRSRIGLLKGPCSFAIQTGPILIDQFLWTNRWVKYRMSLKAKKDVRLEVGMYGNFRAAMDIFVVISPSMIVPCRKEFQGKRILLGQFHFNRSKFSIIRGPGSVKVRFKRRGNKRAARSVYLNWPRTEKEPQLQDEFEMPANLATPIYRARFKTSGQYYIGVIPSLSFKVSETSAVALQKQRRPRKKRLKMAH
jgi:hypothetical protein